MANFMRFGKGRIIVSVYTYLMGVLFVDVVGLKFWLYALLFLPLNWLVAYFIYGWVFKRPKRKTKPIKKVAITGLGSSGNKGDAAYHSVMLDYCEKKWVEPILFSCTPQQDAMFFKGVRVVSSSRKKIFKSA